MELHSESALVRSEDGHVTCRFCGEQVIESPWVHVSWLCQHIQAQEIDGITKSADLIEEAKVKLQEDPTLWLRGIPPTDLPDPLAMSFTAFEAGSDGSFREVDFQAEPINVEGLLLGGDGSGGEHTKDPRIKRCGFGVAILQITEAKFKVIKLCFGTVPGGQDSYRAEATAILFALLRTIGNCVMVVDNEAVFKTFKNLPQ